MHKVGIHIFAPFSILLIILIGCAEQPVVNPDIQTLPSLTAHEPTKTETPPSPTSSYLPTSTETSLPSATPSPTPTLALPVALKTQFPIPTERITAKNVNQLRELANYGAPVLLDFRMTADRKRGVVVTTQGVGIFDLETSQLIKNIPALVYVDEETGYSNPRISINQDGSRLAVLSNKSAQVWDIDDGMILEIELNSQVRMINKAVISPDGQTLAVYDVQTDPKLAKSPGFTLYDISTRKEIQNRPILNGFELIFSPDGRWMIEWSYPKAYLWQVNGWIKLQEFASSTQTGQGVLNFSPDGYLLAYQDGEKISVYQVSPWKLVRQINERSLNIYDNQGPLFSPSGEKILTKDNVYYFPERATYIKVSVWDITTGQPLGTQEIPYEVWILSLSDDGVVTSIQIPVEVCLGLGFYQDKDCINYKWFSDRQMEARINESEIFVLSKDFDLSEACRFIPGSAFDCSQMFETVFLNSDGEIYTIRQPSEEAPYEVYQGQGEGISYLGNFLSSDLNVTPYWISRDLRLLLISTTSNPYFIGNIELWDIQKGLCIRRWTGFQLTPKVSPDGKFISIVEAYEFSIYNILENETIFTTSFGNQITKTPGFNNQTSPSFTQDGRLLYTLVSVKNSFYKFDLMQIDLASRIASPLISFDQKSLFLNSIATSLDGTLLALGLPDGTIQIYDLQTKRELVKWQAHQGNITDLFFSPDGLYLVSSAVGSHNYGDGFLKVWGIWSDR